MTARSLPALAAIERLAATHRDSEVLARVGDLPIHAFRFGTTRPRPRCSWSAACTPERIADVALAYLTTLVARSTWIRCCTTRLRAAA